MTEHTIGKHVENIYVSLRMPPSPHGHWRVLAVLVYLSAGYAPPGSMQDTVDAAEIRRPCAHWRHR